MPASTRPGIGPAPPSMIASSTPGVRHASHGRRGGGLELGGGVVAELEGRPARVPAAAEPEPGDDADHVVEQVADRPLRARRLVVVLVGPHPGDDAVGVVEGLLERIDEVHGNLRSV